MSAEDLFSSLLAQLNAQSLPPVHLWRPERNGQIDMRIDHNGRWFHEGELIKREAMVKVFSSILRRDPDGYVLVTPAERLLIEVEDVPFIAVDCDVRSTAVANATDLLFTTNVQDLVLADSEHPIWLATQASNYPYITVRPGLDARIARSVYYRLLDHAVIKDGLACLYSDGCEFVLGAVE